MEMASTYSGILSQNTAIWAQAISQGMLVVASGGLMGWAMITAVNFFKMLSR